MSRPLTASERGDMAQALLPEAAALAVEVHEGAPQDIATRLAGLSRHELEGLAVVLAAMVDPDRSMGEALAWVDFDERGQLVLPSWEESRTVRHLAPEPEPGAVPDEEYVDEVAVQRFVDGWPVEVTDAEFLVAVQRCVARDMSLPDIDRLHREPARTTEKRVNRLRKRELRAGRAFPSLQAPGVRTFTEAEVVAIRERSAAGATDVEVALVFGTDQKTVSHICRGERYGQFGGPVRAARSSRPSEASRAVWMGSGEKGSARRDCAA